MIEKSQTSKVRSAEVEAVVEAVGSGRPRPIGRWVGKNKVGIRKFAVVGLNNYTLRLLLDYNKVDMERPSLVQY